MNIWKWLFFELPRHFGRGNLRVCTTEGGLPKWRSDEDYRVALDDNGIKLYVRKSDIDGDKAMFVRDYGYAIFRNQTKNYVEHTS